MGVVCVAAALEGHRTWDAPVSACAPLTGSGPALSLRRATAPCDARLTHRARSRGDEVSMLHSDHPMAAPMDVPIGLPEQRRIHVSEFHRMVEVGILSEDDRVELLEGVLVAMPPMGEPHAWSIQELTHRIVRALPEGYRVRPQLPVTLGEYSEPQPDLAVVSLDDGGSRTEHPEHALLVIEVAVSSLRYDRLAEGPVYARWGIPEYWIVDVEGRAVEVHTLPDREAARYRSVVKLSDRDELRAQSVPLPAIAVADILP